VVVTGGGSGIGAAIAEEFGRVGAFVVTLDPMVTVDGKERLGRSERTTVQRIVDAGGLARASDLSVTDANGVQALFDELVAEFGALDAVVNMAGISRPTGIGAGLESDWADVLNVHFEGYRNVLAAALPAMVEAGHGRILGVTSGSGWRPANAGAYGCAKRAVAALTWQIGRVLPPGVTVNALSPIAATRMVTGGAPAPGLGTTGGLSLTAMPSPENLGPVGVYLASEDFSWSSGEIVFSGGSEVAVISPPRLLEVVGIHENVSVGHVLDAVVPTAFLAAEAAQGTNGGTNPRFGPIFDEPGGTASMAWTGDGICVVVTDDIEWGRVIGDALSSRGATPFGVGAWRASDGPRVDLPFGFVQTSEGLAKVARDAGPIDAVIVAVAGGRAAGVRRAPVQWQEVLADHEGVVDDVRADAGWARAVSDYAVNANRAVRVVTITEATSAGGRTRAQVAAQLARGAQLGTSGSVAAFAIGVEALEGQDRRSAAELAAHLVCSREAAALSGAELVAASGWVGLRSHPSPTASITFGGPAVPAWLDRALQRVISK
jgi:NAD(P)-dependent dehydrogenase (short-subunit alcohol dehydrogenase family)